MATHLTTKRDCFCWGSLHSARINSLQGTPTYTLQQKWTSHMIIVWHHMRVTWFISHSSGDPSGSYTTKSWLERVIVVGVPSAPNSVKITSGTISCDQWCDNWSLISHCWAYKVCKSSVVFVSVFFLSIYNEPWALKNQYLALSWNLLTNSTSSSTWT